MLSQETKEKLILSLLNQDETNNFDDNSGDWKIVILQRGWVVVGNNGGVIA